MFIYKAEEADIKEDEYKEKISIAYPPEILPGPLVGWEVGCGNTLKRAEARSPGDDPRAPHSLSLQKWKGRRVVLTSVQPETGSQSLTVAFGVDRTKLGFSVRLRGKVWSAR